MKITTAITAAILTISTAIAGVAQANGQYYGSQVTTAAIAKNLSDETPVRIKGKIVRMLGKEKFELQDATGKITVEIDDDYYYNPQELVGKNVTIDGEIDASRRHNRIEIDADHVQIH